MYVFEPESNPCNLNKKRGKYRFSARRRRPVIIMHYEQKIFSKHVRNLNNIYYKTCILIYRFTPSAFFSSVISKHNDAPDSYFTPARLFRHNRTRPTGCSVWTKRSNVMIIPGRKQCMDGWTLEYYGYLSGGNSVHMAETAEFICLDADPEIIPDGQASNNDKLIVVFVRGSLWHLVSLPTLRFLKA